MIKKPWGSECLIYSSMEYAVKKLFMDRDESCSLQYHKKKKETIYVLSGVLEVYVNGEKHVCVPGDSITIKPGERHKMVGFTNVEYLECSTPELDDVVRLEDKYGRV